MLTEWYPGRGSHSDRDTKTETSDTSKGRTSIEAAVNGRTPEEIRRDLNQLLGKKVSALKLLLSPPYHPRWCVLTGNLIYHPHTWIHRMMKWPEDDTIIYTAHSCRAQETSENFLEILVICPAWAWGDRGVDGHARGVRASMPPMEWHTTHTCQLKLPEHR